MQYDDETENQCQDWNRLKMRGQSWYRMHINIGSGVLRALRVLESVSSNGMAVGQPRTPQLRSWYAWQVATMLLRRRVDCQMIYDIYAALP